jgi:ATP-dependent DNA helicase RecG
MSHPLDLVALLSKGENAHVEFKESIASLSGVKEAVCAFANDLGGDGTPGVVLIGVDKRGKAIGVPDEDAVQQRLAQIRVDGSITPTPSLGIERLTTADRTVFALRVQPSDSPPVRFSGVAYVRVGTVTTKATPEEERRLTEERRARATPFDARGIPGTSRDNLDLRRFQLDYLPRAVSPQVLEENNRPLAQQLAALKLSDTDGRATPTGLLVAGVDPLAWLPGAYVQFRRVSGSDITGETLDDARIGGTIETVVRLVEDKLAAHNMTSLTITAKLHERRPLYPPIAISQLVRNAIMHRDYEVYTPVRVTWFDDRLQIDNPGGPFQIPKGKFGEPGFTGYRNPNIAEAMHNLGLVEKFGVGIALARKALAQNGSPPLELRAEEGFVFVTLRAAWRPE